MSNRFDDLQSQGLVSIVQPEGEFSPRIAPESPRDDRGSRELRAIPELSLEEKAAKFVDERFGSRQPRAVPIMTASEGAAAKLNDHGTQNPFMRTIHHGKYMTPEKPFAPVDPVELANLERLVTRLAGSPLGCVEFEKTFRSRQRENHILVLKDHELDGLSFGEVCGQYSKVTILGIRNSAGTPIWAPAPYVKLHSTDELMLIGATPFALAVGLCQEESLAGTPGRTDFMHLTDFKPGTQVLGFQTDLAKENRRCCI